MKFAVGEIVFQPPCDEAWKKLTEWAESNTYKPDTTDPKDADADADAADADSGTPKTAAEWDKAVKDAEAKWRRGEIDGDELTRIQNERDCAKGLPWAQNCS